MDRREFVGALGAAAALPSLGWLPRRDRIDDVGLQLYTVRDQMQHSVERTLYDVGKIGFKEVEFAGYFDRPPRAIRQLLDRNGLKSPSGHIPIDRLDTGWYKTLAESEEIGHKWLVVAWLANEDRDSLDAIKRTAERFNRAGERAKDFKIRFAYHNHDFEFKEVEGRRIFDVLLEETDPAYVDFELDLYWITKGGADPFEYFRRWPERFPLIHVKDGTGAEGMPMTEVGKGIIDFKAIFAQHKLAGMKHYYVEHDNPGDSLASAATSYRYLHSLEF